MLAVLAAPIGAVLYRLRGGWFTDLTGIKSTHIMRLIWALPTSLLIYLQMSDGLSWWQVPALAAAVWASLSLWGHGAHMIMGDYKQWLAFAQKTENLTDWWLPQLMGWPKEEWPVWKLDLYQILGMGFIGFVRHLTMFVPIANSRETETAAFALLGLLHGPLYWASWRIGWKSQGGECFVGALMWSGIILVFS